MFESKKTLNKENTNLFAKKSVQKKGSEKIRDPENSIRFFFGKQKIGYFVNS